MKLKEDRVEKGGLSTVERETAFAVRLGSRMGRKIEAAEYPAHVRCMSVSSSFASCTLLSAGLALDDNGADHF